MVKHHYMPYELDRKTKNIYIYIYVEMCVYTKRKNLKVEAFIHTDDITTQSTYISLQLVNLALCCHQYLPHKSLNHDKLHL